jgi:hypothetical protein
MKPIDATLICEESREDLLLTQIELGKAITLSIQSVTFETLPHEIALLLMRLAMAEVLRDAVNRDAEDADV